MLASLEMLTSEDTMLAIVRRLLIQHRYRNFRLENFIELLRPLLVDNIDLGQVWTLINCNIYSSMFFLFWVYDFWFKNGGIQNLLAEKTEDRLRLVQQNEGRQAQMNAGQWARMPLWPLAVSIRNVSLPFKLMLSKVLELAPLDRKLLPLTNLGFGLFPPSLPIHSPL
jgi:hypothetical protein